MSVNHFSYGLGGEGCVGPMCMRVSLKGPTTKGGWTLWKRKGARPHPQLRPLTLKSPWKTTSQTTMDHAPLKLTSLFLSLFLLETIDYSLLFLFLTFYPFPFHVWLGNHRNKNNEKNNRVGPPPPFR